MSYLLRLFAPPANPRHFGDVALWCALVGGLAFLLWTVVLILVMVFAP